MDESTDVDKEKTEPSKGNDVFIKEIVTNKSLAEAKVSIYLGKNKKGEVYSKIDGKIPYDLNLDVNGYADKQPNKKNFVRFIVEKDGYGIRDVSFSISNLKNLKMIELSPLRSKIKWSLISEIITVVSIFILLYAFLLSMEAQSIHYALIIISGGFLVASKGFSIFLKHFASNRFKEQ